MMLLNKLLSNPGGEKAQLNFFSGKYKISCRSVER